MNQIGSKLAASVRQVKEQSEQKQKVDSTPPSPAKAETPLPALPRVRVWPD